VCVFSDITHSTFGIECCSILQSGYLQLCFQPHLIDIFSLFVLQTLSCSILQSVGSDCSMSFSSISRLAVGVDISHCSSNNTTTHTIAWTALLYTRGNNCLFEWTKSKWFHYGFLTYLIFYFILLFQISLSTRMDCLAVGFTVFSLLAVNVVVGYVFVYRPFIWADGSVARFMYWLNFVLFVNIKIVLCCFLMACTDTNRFLLLFVQIKHLWSIKGRMFGI
jgi:hypothetical protein